jgi:hypothetical protein
MEMIAGEMKQAPRAVGARGLIIIALGLPSARS